MFSAPKLFWPYYLISHTNSNVQKKKNRCFKDFIIIDFHSQKTQYEKEQGNMALMILKLTVFKGQSLGLTHWLIYSFQRNNPHIVTSLQCHKSNLYSTCLPSFVIKLYTVTSFNQLSIFVPFPFHILRYLTFQVDFLSKPHCLVF